MYLLIIYTRNTTFSVTPGASRHGGRRCQRVAFTASVAAAAEDTHQTGVFQTRNRRRRRVLFVTRPKQQAYNIYNTIIYNNIIPQRATPPLSLAAPDPYIILCITTTRRYYYYNILLLLLCAYIYI